MKRHKNEPTYVMPSILTTLAVAVSYVVFSNNDLLTSVIFILLIPLFLYFNWDGRIPVAYAAVIFIITAVTLVSYQNFHVANEFSVYAFWLLVVGVICLIVTHLEEKSSLQRF